MPTGTLYEILQVQPTADFEIIQAAYRRMVLRYHPDRNDSVDAREMTQQLNQAFEVLSDPIKRAAYDQELSAKREPRRPSHGPSTSSQATSDDASPSWFNAILPTRAWVTGILGALIISSLLVVVGSGESANPLDWFSDAEEIIGAFDQEAATNAPAGSNPIGSVAVSQETPPSLPNPTAIPTATAVPPLTVRDIFILESNGEITPILAALLLKLTNQGLSPSLDQPGAITVTSVTPTVDVCRYVECVGGTLPVGQNDPITLNAMVEPINPIADKHYMVWLADLDGSTLNAHRITWSEEHLGNTTADKDSGRVKFISITSPIFDISIPEFIKDYNDVFLRGLEEF
nr:J domain-containing protein [Chloroflexota bacterium]